MTFDEFFAEAKRLNLRMLGTPDETRAALDLRDAEIARLRAALHEVLEFQSAPKTPTIHDFGRWRRLMALGPNVELTGRPIGS